jgi:alkanesulfonate monooxygenase SsuD/methylene tetrahydromethanopterin reductase-like flavin-dependent oxidoreductase (luciferase family)
VDLALVSLGDHLPDPTTGREISQAEKFRLMVDSAVRAEAAGFDAVMLGEHHFCGYILSVPQLALAAIAERTTRLRLNTGVTLLPTQDPVRLAEDFATLDVLSSGRAEITVGRGILQSTYRAMDRPISASREIFAESLDLLLRLLTEEKVTWSGQWRAPLEDVTVQPRSVQQPRLPVWVGGGSSPASVDLAARAGTGLMLPGVFGAPKQFAPFADRYREAHAAAGHDPADRHVGTVFHCHVARSSQEARRRWEPYYRSYLAFVDDLWDGEDLFDAKVRPSNAFDYDRLLRSAAVCGSPAEVADRISQARDLLGLDLAALSLDLGGLPAPLLDEAIDLVGAEVIPALR